MPDTSHRRPIWLSVAVACLAFLVVAAGVYFAQAFRTVTPADASAGTQLGPTTPSAQAESAAGILEAARQASLAGDHARAATTLARGLESHPTDADMHLARARALVASRDFAEAYKHYESALAIIPKDPRRPLGDPKLHFEMGTVANQAGMLDRALEHYSMAQSMDPAEPQYPLYVAMVQIKLGQDPAAMASLVRVTVLNDQLPAAWGTLAELALKQNQLSLALQHVEKARKLEPASTRWRLVQARTLKRRGGAGAAEAGGGTTASDIEQAAALLAALPPEERQRPEVMSVLAECYGLMNKPEQAGAMYAEALASTPGSVDFAYEAAVWYERAGLLAQAHQYAEIAEDLGHEDAATLLRKLNQR